VKQFAFRRPVRVLAGMVPGVESCQLRLIELS
jgi:hypothetical protein